MDESLPEPQADSALVPPPRVPPTALATIEPIPPHRRLTRESVQRDWTVLIDRALDQLDTIADRIAHATGLR